jgi:ubiquinone/menaquinone biosynthesis C-methylase UbiE
MPEHQEEYLLSRAPNEVDRLQSWSRSWEPETEAMLDRIQIQPGWHCLDLACGPLGIINSLSRRVGPTGKVVGADINPLMLTAVRNFVVYNNIDNVELVETDSYQSSLPCESFDLVHARAMFAPLGRDNILLDEMMALTRPGGIIVSQESDESGYLCYPPQPPWERLKQLTIAAFKLSGGDYSAGRHTYDLFRTAGLENLQARVANLALPAGHPFRNWPIESAIALRGRMLELKLIKEFELDQLISKCDLIARDPDIFLTSYTVIQVWGQKPIF